MDTEAENMAASTPDAEGGRLERTRAPREVDAPLLTWLWRSYLKPQRMWLGVAFIFMVIEGSMLGALSYIIQPMFDQVFIGGDSSAVYIVAGIVGGIFLLRAISAFTHRILIQGAGLRIITSMQKDMVAHLLTLDSAYFRTNPPGSLIERVRGDTAAANMIWGSILATAGRDVTSLVVLLGVAISVDPLWTLVAVAGVPLLLGPVVALQKFVRKTTLRARDAAGRLTLRLDEIFHGVDTIKLNTSESREHARFTDATSNYLRQEMKARLGQAGIPMMTDFVAAIGFTGVLIYGGNQIIDGEKTVGEFMSFFTAMGLIFEPLRRVANISGAWQSARANLERLQEVFRHDPTILSPTRPARLAVPAEEADIVFDNVVVRYSDEPALNGTTFTAKGGETTALVGASGAGKSTIFNTLTRLVDPTEGQVRIGGILSENLSLDELRALFSVVTQDAPMFDESIRDNLVLNTQNLGDQDILAAIEAANLKDFVDRLPEGLETPAGPRGSALSGGQRQRIAIARALLRRAPILLLDEATSALDAESEVRVQEALDRLSDHRTTLVIAHRLSTIRRADKIVVMEAGRVVDEGRHEELLARGGVYAKLHALQFEE